MPPMYLTSTPIRIAAITTVARIPSFAGNFATALTVFTVALYSVVPVVKLPFTSDRMLSPKAIAIPVTTNTNAIGSSALMLNPFLLSGLSVFIMCCYTPPKWFNHYVVFKFFIANVIYAIQ